MAAACAGARRRTQTLAADPPHTELDTANPAARVKSHPTLAALLTDEALPPGLVEGVSYGPEIDAPQAQSANLVT